MTGMWSNEQLRAAVAQRARPGWSLGHRLELRSGRRRAVRSHGVRGRADRSDVSERLAAAAPAVGDRLGLAPCAPLSTSRLATTVVTRQASRGPLSLGDDGAAGTCRAGLAPAGNVTIMYLKLLRLGQRQCFISSMGLANLPSSLATSWQRSQSVTTSPDSAPRSAVLIGFVYGRRGPQARA
jgi:hypothetical protein